jgi:hypothetical protein
MSVKVICLRAGMALPLAEAASGHYSENNHTCQCKCENRNLCGSITEPVAVPILPDSTVSE